MSQNGNHFHKIRDTLHLQYLGNLVHETQQNGAHHTEKSNWMEARHPSLDTDSGGHSYIPNTLAPFTVYSFGLGSLPLPTLSSDFQQDNAALWRRFKSPIYPFAPTPHWALLWTPGRQHGLPSATTWTGSLHLPINLSTAFLTSHYILLSIPFPSVKAGTISYKSLHF